MTTHDIFSRITAALQQAGIQYMLTGSVASAYYGAPRATRDIDLVIAPDPDQLGKFIRLLPSAEYYVDLDAALQALRTRSLFNMVDLATGWKIDFIIRKARPFSEVEFQRRVAIQLEGTQLFVAAAEDIVISKLEWAKLAESQRQIEDVAGILRMQQDSLDLAYIQKWVGELGLGPQWDAARRAAEFPPSSPEFSR
jgi:hypothetical protein